MIFTFPRTETIPNVEEAFILDWLCYANMLSKPETVIYSLCFKKNGKMELSSNGLLDITFLVLKSIPM